MATRRELDPEGPRRGQDEAYIDPSINMPDAEQFVGNQVEVPGQHPGKQPGTIEAGPIPSQSGETPREREDLRQGGAVTSTPRRPSEPTPMAGSSFEAGEGAPGFSGGVIPFAPMGSSVLPSSPTSRLRGLFGRAGGLQGGGLGTPFDPTPNEASDPISGLIARLRDRKVGFF